MPVDVFMGGHWGDEGKGKIVDYFSDSADAVARYGGGSNAGHTIIRNDEEIVFSSVPSGILNYKILSIIGQGCVVNPDILMEEIEKVEEINDGNINLIVSENSNLVLPFHVQIDKDNENGDFNIGTTKQGIGPAYADKVNRFGIKVKHLYSNDMDFIKNQYEQNKIILERKDIQILPFKEYMKKIDIWRRGLENYKGDAEKTIREMLNKNKKIIAEGAQGAMLDLDNGTYHFVTSSNTGIGGVLNGLGVNHKDIGDVITVFKAYITRVGNGPFPSEMNEEKAYIMRELAGEYGSRTRRPRRIGWFDVDIASYSIEKNGADLIILTRLDSLDYEKEIPIFYNNKFIECKGWESSTKGYTNWDNLPKNAKHYINTLEEMLHKPINGISTGPKKHEIILRNYSL